MPYNTMSSPNNNRRVSNAPRGVRREYPVTKNHSDNLELINYVFESWSQVQGAHKADSNVTYYTPNNESNNRLENFTPFNLERWWGQKLVERCQSRNS